STVNAAGTNEDNAELLVDPNMPALEDYSIFDLSSDDQSSDWRFAISYTNKKYVKEFGGIWVC
ncbi:hypothetical protein Tco_1048519, partial [Tanacetum coccineum]